ncbi:unnamed protein product [Lymnaea stagnalis]|uniref:Uncharacterized protein n=1 Tax=Lymnaea stagnalis TaxID=6523 RepID=A0AAV2IAF6_LYMST
MEKLAMDVTSEEMELTITAIPQLTNFTAVATLHDPHPAKGDNKGGNEGNGGAQKLSRADGLDGANVSKQEVNSTLPNAVSKEAESVSDLPPAAPVSDKVNVDTRANQDGCDQVPTPTIEHSGAKTSSLISNDGAPDVNKNISPITSEENIVELSKQQEIVLALGQENDVICRVITSQNSLASSPLSSGRGWKHPFT